ncbi:putative DNA repair and recombination protein pif1 [Rosellinia necatrix]|uniref:ATP-dependent DNA helicase PIF1 n=1 Tax=Rosellinia necatrix TaxID=77044 RepID=A0A1W2TKN4_ROSNE|nr:putative DNA repair and recombination protein pif1 [Rosellinia necatrix]
MLGRAATARDKAKGAVAPTGTSTARSDLAKQLFSSSPPLPSSSSRRRDITSWALPANASRATNPLAPTSSNPHLPPTAKSTKSTKTATSSGAPTLSHTNSLVSICSNAGSFEERPSYGTSQPHPHGSIISSVFVTEDDFSDDDALELDYVCPGKLPPLPPTSKPAPSSKTQPTAAMAHATTNTGPPPTSQVSWPSSPQHHLFPPPKPDTSKREPPSHALPPAKKRTLPSSFRNNESETLAATDEADHLATPAPNKTKTLPWDATQSAVKERRKLLKNQSKKSESDADMPATTDNRVRQNHPTGLLGLSPEQTHVLHLVVKDGKSVFFTGPAGTGKSVLMRAIIEQLKKKWARDPERLSVTASTGLAACNIGGQTLHSFAGIGLGKEDVPSLVKKIRRSAKAKNRWLRTNTLIIDEVSMVDGDLFDKLSEIARIIRRNGRPFGGIQLVITGDFFQLPPVPDGGKKEAKFAFDAATWNTSIDHTIGLTHVFRQKDPQFAGMLNEMRLGRISDDTVRTFKQLARPLTFDDGLDVTELFPTRYEVERSNELRLRNLAGETHRYEATDSGDPNIREKLLANMMAPKVIELKKGGQVMLIKNMDDTLVNGSLGKVTGFMAEAAFEATFATQSEDEQDDETGADAIKKIKAYALNADSTKDLREYPVVRFTAADGTHRIVLCVPEDWKVELPTGEVQASRKQIPLILAWALSIHKAQGQTLERVKVDLGKVFEKGQAYVALSRAVSKGGLQVLRFEEGKVMAHPRVIHFYNNLSSVESAIKTQGTTSTMSEPPRDRVLINLGR